MGRISRISRWIKSSWEYTTKGASARKLTAFSITSCVISMHAVWVAHAFSKEDFTLMVSILYADYAFVGALLGMTTYQYLKQNVKNEDNDKGQL